MKVSVNGGPFELVPAAAFSFNAYNTMLITEADGNTNPLAGQPAFTGTDGGEVTGTWGQSQVDLTAIGIRPATGSDCASTWALTAAAASTGGTSTTSSWRSASPKQHPYSSGSTNTRWPSAADHVGGTRPPVPVLIKTPGNLHPLHGGYAALVARRRGDVEEFRSIHTLTSP